MLWLGDTQASANCKEVTREYHVAALQHTHDHLQMPASSWTPPIICTKIGPPEITNVPRSSPLTVCSPNQCEGGLGNPCHATHTNTQLTDASTNGHLEWKATRWVKGLAVGMCAGIHKGQPGLTNRLQRREHELESCSEREHLNTRAAIT